MATPGAALIELVPRKELAPGGAATIRTQVINAVLAQASIELRMPIEKLVVRDLRPLADLDYTYETWRERTGSTVEAYETMSTGTMLDQRYVAIYGVRDASAGRGCVSLLKLNVGGGDRAIWNLENLDEEGIGYCPSAIVIPPNAPYTLSRWVVVAGQSAQIILKGVVVEPRGKVVSP